MTNLSPKVSSGCVDDCHELVAQQGIRYDRLRSRCPATTYRSPSDFEEYLGFWCNHWIAAGEVRCAVFGSRDSSAHTLTIAVKCVQFRMAGVSSRTNANFNSNTAFPTGMRLPGTSTHTDFESSMHKLMTRVKFVPPSVRPCEPNMS